MPCPGVPVSKLVSRIQNLAFELTAMDVETAYLQAPLRDGVEVYMYQP